MQMALFLKNKINRQISINGCEYVFNRHKVDKYKQMSNEVLENIIIKGLLHTTNVYVKSNESENSRIVKKQQSMILTLYDDGIQIKKDDAVVIVGKVYKVVEKTDVNNLSVAFDISLEEIL